ncbi:hypothetical protein JIN84_18690 [Luteolibacter yonseiensis]|uniref:PEP-CTERM protein-sorting domain-containing protein n=1 Tax=Luteolibacter yonseiensis TaxID=1144680 RepID=A0A934R9T0_9BACT|nr:hypothetical protein [Luteolibacter yonseiensis]MBK1817654.1 hypothetical protein [Luteolibacter yonseiensis]
MADLRKIIASQILGGLLAAHASAAVQIGFDTAADLTDNFTVSFVTTGSGNNLTPVTYSTTAGLGGGGGMLVLEDSRDQYAILNDPFTLAAGVEYKVGALIRSYHYVGIGFTDDNSYASIDFQPTNSIMLSTGDSQSMNVSNYYNGNQEWNSPNSIDPVPPIPVGSWMALNLSMTYNGAGSFDLAYSIDLTDADGNVLDRALDGAYSVTNTGFTGNLHPFIFFQKDMGRAGEIAADNFTASAVPEPSSAMAAIVGLALGLTAIRRRQRP